MPLRNIYNAELAALTEQLIRMGALANDAIRRALQALDTNDHELAQGVINGDREVDEMERAIEHRCLTLLLRQQPVAGDLRRVSTAIKMITDIERIGDAAADIAELTIHASGKLPCMDDLRLMSQAAQGMVEDCIKAYVDEDLKLASEVIARDDIVDNYFNTVKSDIARYIADGGKELDGAIDTLMVSKYLERLGDHAVNISEWVEFCKTGVHKKSKIV